MKILVTSNQLYFRFDPQYNPYMNIRRIHNQLAYTKNKQTGIIMLFFLYVCLFVFVFLLKCELNIDKNSLKRVSTWIRNILELRTFSNCQICNCFDSIWFNIMLTTITNTYSFKIEIKYQLHSTKIKLQVKGVIVA